MSAREIGSFLMHLEASIYLMKLEDVLRLVSPITPDLSAGDFLKIKKRANWIFKKLEHFKDPRFDSLALDGPEHEREKTNLEIAAEEYYARLRKALHRLPSAPPRELIERDFLIIKGTALLIMKTLERFREGASAPRARIGGGE